MRRATHGMSHVTHVKERECVPHVAESIGMHTSVRSTGRRWKRARVMDLQESSVSNSSGAVSVMSHVSIGQSHMS